MQGKRFTTSTNIPCVKTSHDLQVYANHDFTFIATPNAANAANAAIAANATERSRTSRAESSLKGKERPFAS